jgi:hypothetical protein
MGETVNGATAPVIPAVVTGPAGPMARNKFYWNKWGHDLLWFALVPLTFWITAVLGKIQLPNHVVSVKDFGIGNDTTVSIIVYVFSSLLNIIRKYVN